MIQDNSKAADIMLTCELMIIKSIGDTTPTTQIWTDNQLKVTEKGLWAKFTQNANLLIDAVGKREAFILQMISLNK